MRRARVLLCLLSFASVLALPVALALPPLVTVPDASEDLVGDALAQAAEAPGTVARTGNGTLGGVATTANATLALVEQPLPPLAAIPPASPLPADPALLLPLPAQAASVATMAEDALAEEIESAIRLACDAVAGAPPDALLYAEKRLARLEMRLASLTAG